MVFFSLFPRGGNKIITNFIVYMDIWLYLTSLLSKATNIYGGFIHRFFLLSVLCYFTLLLFSYSSVEFRSVHTFSFEYVERHMTNTPDEYAIFFLWAGARVSGSASERVREWASEGGGGGEREKQSERALWKVRKSVHLLPSSVVVCSISGVFEFWFCAITIK